MQLWYIAILFVLPWLLVLTVITVRFAQPSYTFVENELSGEVEVIRNGDSIVPISVRVFGGTYQHRNEVSIQL